ncbi:ROK family protein [Virgibacillus salexigens]|uniref:Beta-glucoside kinase n=2 Tax=Virgibacillus TaxID=84406 RepID=A0A024Q9V0_9BACI|nr:MULTISPECIES: ROK family protein [Virgibacillus]GGJ58675.1 transcriptional regulator [Virgibacillus kapii]CDQ38731.1 Beta-glucoside kinase [Virgibacillus massiliensis]
MESYFSIDIGGTYIKMGVVNDQGEISQLEKVNTPSTIEALMDVMDHYLKRQINIKGVAVSSPGAVSDHGIVYGSSAVPYLHGPNIKEMLSERFNLPVYVENDANCAAYAELWKGAAKGKKDILVVVIGTGIGGAVIKDGTIHKGANLHGGEFGYMLLNTNITGDDDVWSRVASTRALVKKVAKQKGLSNIQELTGERIFQLADSGDNICIEALEEFYHILAVGIYNLQYIYDPEIILLGGGISERVDLIDAIDEKVDAILAKIDLSTIKPTIKFCHFRQHANLLGSVYGYRKQIEKRIND